MPNSNNPAEGKVMMLERGKNTLEPCHEWARGNRIVCTSREPALQRSTQFNHNNRSEDKIYGQRCKQKCYSNCSVF